MNGIEAFITGMLLIGALFALVLLAPVAIGVGGLIGLVVASGLAH